MYLEYLCKNNIRIVVTNICHIDWWKTKIVLFEPVMLSMWKCLRLRWNAPRTVLKMPILIFVTQIGKMKIIFSNYKLNLSTAPFITKLSRQVFHWFLILFKLGIRIKNSNTPSTVYIFFFILKVNLKISLLL